jgi:hypothetical protein
MNTTNSDTAATDEDNTPDGNNGTRTPVTSTEAISKRKKTSDISHSDLVDASIGQMLNSLLEIVPMTQDLPDLNTIATILQRLVATSQQVHALRGQLGEGTGANRPQEGDGLDTTTVRKLERQLKLL